MNIFENKSDLSNSLKRMREEGKTIGFVPTMGALHQGHLSLIDECNRDNDICVASIFVNPTQFNNADDLKNYPRTLEVDIELLRENNCDIIFIPSVDEMYSNTKKASVSFNFGSLAEVMEGRDRPGHFEGVATIVKKLFEIIIPDTAYFGKKDYQQLLIIKELTKQYNLSPKIIGCEIIREDDGLAMSSRNTRLTNNQRNEVALINKTLQWAKSRKNDFEVERLKRAVKDRINSSKLMKVVYFEIADADNLLPCAEWGKMNKPVGFIVVKVGDVRLIDNVELY